MTTTKLSDVLARATEAAAIAAHAHVGDGNLEVIDRAAVDAMRRAFANGSVLGHVAIGEGEKDGAPMLHNGEVLGPGGGTPVDLAVDPIDGTRAAALGTRGSVSALAAAPSGAMFRPGSVAYMEKLLGPRDCEIHLDMPTDKLIATVASTLDTSVGQLQVAILDRPRNAARMTEVRAAGAQVVALPYADLSACVAVATGAGSIGLLLGIGGCAEGVLAAASASALGATMQCRLWPRDEDERRAAQEQGLSCSEILDAESLVGTLGLSLALTGVTGSVLLDPIETNESGLVAHSVRIDSGHAPRFTRSRIASTGSNEKPE